MYRQPCKSFSGTISQLSASSIWRNIVTVWSKSSLYMFTKGQQFLLLMYVSGPALEPDTASHTKGWLLDSALTRLQNSHTSLSIKSCALCLLACLQACLQSALRH